MAADGSSTDILSESFETRSPFIDGASFAKAPPKPAPGSSAAAPQASSPFLNLYETEGQPESMEPDDELFAELMSELQDDEFDDAVSAVITEAAELVEDRLAGEIGDPVAKLRDAEHLLEGYFTPLQSEIDGFLQHMEQESADRDLDVMEEAKVESSHLERFMV